MTEIEVKFKLLQIVTLSVHIYFLVALLGTAAYYIESIITFVKCFKTKGEN